MPPTLGICVLIQTGVYSFFGYGLVLTQVHVVSASQVLQIGGRRMSNNRVNLSRCGHGHMEAKRTSEAPRGVPKSSKNGTKSGPHLHMEPLMHGMRACACKCWLGVCVQLLRALFLIPLKTAQGEGCTRSASIGR